MSSQVGNIGEAACKLWLLKENWEVYEGADGNYYDFIAYNIPDNRLLRVEVKTSRARNRSNTGWKFNIQKRRTFGEHDIPFDNTKVDILALYIEPLDKVVIVEAKDVTQKRQYLILDKDL